MVTRNMKLKDSLKKVTLEKEALVQRIVPMEDQLAFL